VTTNEEQGSGNSSTTPTTTVCAGALFYIKEFDKPKKMFDILFFMFYNRTLT